MNKRMREKNFLFPLLFLNTPRQDVFGELTYQGLTTVPKRQFVFYLLRCNAIYAI